MVYRQVERVLDPVPEKGKRYHFFDDGKTGPSRHYIVEVVDVIPFWSLKALKYHHTWCKEKKHCDWLYANKTDYFVITKGVYQHGQKPVSDDTLVYCRTHGGGWFSFGRFWYDGELDVTGEIYKRVSEWYNEECAPEIGLGTYDQVSQTEGLI